MQQTAGTPRRILQLNERVLIVFAALSLVFVYDVFTNNRTVREGFQQSLVRPVVAYQDDLGFTRGVPFVASQGRIDLPSTGITTLYIKAPGDIRLHAADSDSIAIDYTFRTFAESAKAAEAYHELVDVSHFASRGDPGSDLTITRQARIGAASATTSRLPRGVHAIDRSPGRSHRGTRSRRRLDGPAQPFFPTGDRGAGQSRRRER